jgi:hypothetical protein
MPRLVGLGMMIGGDLATTYGLGANGFSDDLPFKSSTVAILDDVESEIEVGDSPETLIAIEVEQEEGEIEIGDAPETLIEIVEVGPETEIEVADGKDC